MAKSDEIPTQYSNDWIEKLDGRTSLARAVQSRYATLAQDLGGINHLSYQRRSLCKRAIYMEAIIEQQEAALSRGEEIDQGRLTQAVNTLIGLLKTLGLERITKEVSLGEFIRGKS
ncbi:MAG: hypothetical protein RQ732_10600 [Methylophaga sp.]|nr:hypothetical protein [Methylophaga sp.]